MACDCGEAGMGWGDVGAVADWLSVYLTSVHNMFQSCNSESNFGGCSFKQCVCGPVVSPFICHLYQKSIQHDSSPPPQPFGYGFVTMVMLRVGELS